MSVPEKVSYLSRFTVKLVEVVGAGVATAVSGYLVAHLGGYFSSPPPASVSAPAVLEAAPNAGTTSKPASGGPRTHGTPAVSADANERPAPAHDSHPSGQPARSPAKAAEISSVVAGEGPAAGSHGASASRKAPTPDSHAGENTPRQAAEDKAHEEEAIAAQVRAALANVDASRPASAEGTPHQPDISPVPADATPKPRPADSPAAAVPVENPPGAATLATPPAQPAPNEPDPLTTVEIKPRPVAAIAATARSRRRAAKKPTQRAFKKPNRTKASSPPSRTSPTCCAPTAPPRPASPPVHRCRSANSARPVSRSRSALGLPGRSAACAGYGRRPSSNSRSRISPSVA
jgi:hypothetical protein